jgi:hypothetical protein
MWPVPLFRSMKQRQRLFLSSLVLLRNGPARRLTWLVPLFRSIRPEPRLFRLRLPLLRNGLRVDNRERINKAAPLMIEAI